MKILITLLYITTAILTTFASLATTSPLNTTTTPPSLNRRWNHGSCSFHVTIREYCSTDTQKHHHLWTLYTSLDISKIIDGAGHPIDALIWDTREYINAGPHWIGIDGGTRWIYGLDTRLQIEWKPDRELGNVEYEYGDCEWSANDYFGSRKCGNCGRGLWTSGASPAQQKPGSNKGCDEQRRWRTQDMDCFFPC